MARALADTSLQEQALRLAKPRRGWLRLPLPNRWHLLGVIVMFLTWEAYAWHVHEERHRASKRVGGRLRGGQVDDRGMSINGSRLALGPAEALIVKLIVPVVGLPERNSLSSWRTLCLSEDPKPRDQWKLGPGSTSRTAGFVGEKKSSPMVIWRGAAPATTGSASNAALAERTTNLRTPLTSSRRQPHGWLRAPPRGGSTGRIGRWPKPRLSSALM